jgi:hypothetical protein
MIDRLGPSTMVIQPKVGHVGKWFLPTDQQLLVPPWLIVAFVK